MKTRLRVALAQINTTVGDLEGNTETMRHAIQTARSRDCDLIAFPELSLTGYPPEDLLLRNQFLNDQDTCFRTLAEDFTDIAGVVGFVDRRDGQRYNAAAFIAKGKVRGVYHKVNLPNYSVFDEERYFRSGSRPMVVHFGDKKIGISICEDIWVEDDVVEAEAIVGGADILLNISASPYYFDKGRERRDLIKARAHRTGAVVAYVNLVGGQDELVFDGQSLIATPGGQLVAEGAAFQTDLVIHDLDVDLSPSSEHHTEGDVNVFTQRFPDLDHIHVQASLSKSRSSKPTSPHRTPVLDTNEQVYSALVLGLRDYVYKNGFSDVTLGLSGGIDSALVAVLATDALGPDHVHTVTMPSRYSSSGSVEDSRQLARNLGIQFEIVAIQGIYDRYIEDLSRFFKGLDMDVTEENLQARIRGNLLMALSNKFGWLVLATGNKSEISVGYSTIYGDMVGGFSPLKDVFKGRVYQLSERVNEKAGMERIPRAILEKAPSAELRPNQTDQDSLPPYDILDAILERYVGLEMGVKEIVSEGFEENMVKEVARLVDINEYKRRQAAPGIKITPRAFGKDRRMPITNQYRAR
jgi:NAD+ synthase (glutamine-hydrolysing)